MSLSESITLGWAGRLAAALLPVTYRCGRAPILCHDEMLVEFELIQRAQKGDESAFNQVVTAYRRRILGTVARLINHPEDVEDVGQEVFLRLYFSLDQLRTPEVFEPWLYRLTVNAAYDYIRKSKRRMEFRMCDLSEQQVILADAAASSKANLSDVQKQQTRSYVEELLSTISEEDRVLLLMKEVEGLTLREMEKVYNVNETALKVRLFRARKRVLKAIEPAAVTKTKATASE